MEVGLLAAVYQRAVLTLKQSRKEARKTNSLGLSRGMIIIIIIVIIIVIIITNSNNDNDNSNNIKK